MKNQKKFCYPDCEFFKCDQKAIIYRRDKKWCRFADDECDPRTCKYVHCIRGRLLNNGVCGFSISVNKVDLKFEDLEKPVKVSKKLASKLRDSEFY